MTMNKKRSSLLPVIGLLIVAGLPLLAANYQVGGPQDHAWSNESDPRPRYAFLPIEGLTWPTRVNAQGYVLGSNRKLWHPEHGIIEAGSGKGFVDLNNNNQVIVKQWGTNSVTWLKDLDTDDEQEFNADFLPPPDEAVWTAPPNATVLSKSFVSSRANPWVLNDAGEAFGKAITTWLYELRITPLEDPPYVTNTAVSLHSHFVKWDGPDSGVWMGQTEEEALNDIEYFRYTTNQKVSYYIWSWGPGFYGGQILHDLASGEKMVDPERPPYLHNNHGGVVTQKNYGSSAIEVLGQGVIGYGYAADVSDWQPPPFNTPDYPMIVGGQSGQPRIWARIDDPEGQKVWEQIDPCPPDRQYSGTLTAVNNNGLIAGWLSLSNLPSQAYVLVPVQITKIWSDQFPGSDANQLPNKPTPSHVGSGSEKHKYILVGGRNPGQQVYIKAKVDFPDVPALKEKFKFALARMSGDTLFIKGPSETIDENGELLLQTSQIDAVGYSDEHQPPQDYAIVGGFDTSGNGLSNSEIAYISEFRIRPVSFAAYEGNRAWLSTFVIGGWIADRPYSAAFLQAFRTGNAISGVGGTPVNETMSIHDDDHPAHHVGIEFNSSNEGPIRRHVWSQYSILANEIASSQEIRWRIQIRLASAAIKGEVQNYQWQPGEFNKTFTWTLDPEENDVLLSFGASDADLHTSFGKAWLNNAQIKVTVDKDTLTATSVVVEGTLTDLYDWDYEEGWEADRRAATVQAGYNTLGPGGWIFRLQVDMNTPSTIPSPPYNFN